MAAISPTAANIRLGTGATSATGTAGETLTAFALVYLKAADGKLWLAINSSEAAANIVGMTLSAASADGLVSYSPSTAGTHINSSSALWTDRLTYIVGDVAGQMMDAADAGSGDYVTVVGVADGTTSLQWVAASTGIT